MTTTDESSTSASDPYHSSDSGAPPPSLSHLTALSIGALGVVYGDIGTSPLYSLKECFQGTHTVPVNPANVLGILSLIIWSLILTISVKYILFIMRADNRGEGGILALLALVMPTGGAARTTHPVEAVGARRFALLGLGLFGAALLYGDGIITPAITVLSAVEGLEVVTPVFRSWVVPLTVAILFLLFIVQRHGTSRVGSVFGPITLLWFFGIGAFGVPAIARNPLVLGAFDPRYAVSFFGEHGIHGFLVLGAVVLAITGGEALYADMGHFGPTPIRFAWFGIVLPALLLNYLGQGANLLTNPGAARNPFYLLLPGWALYPMVVLATLAAVIASQALISGAFSLTHQATQLGYAPRFRIIHTSELESGQIYVPFINWALMIACIALVLGFRSSSNLAAAYGIAVTMTMAITTILFHQVMTKVWRWRRRIAYPLTTLFLSIDLAFCGSNLVKIEHGGWVPLVAGLAVFILLTTWKLGRERVAQLIAKGGLDEKLFLSSLEIEQPHRSKGTAVFMTSTPRAIPLVLLHHVKHNKALHERVLLLSIQAEPRARLDDATRIEVHPIGQGISRVIAHFGFFETPNVPAILQSAKLVEAGLVYKESETTYYFGRETLIPKSTIRGMQTWRKYLYSFMSTNASSAPRYFGIPPNRVVEVGAQIEF
jgi:KUP system potassium uptake protein